MRAGLDAPGRVMARLLGGGMNGKRASGRLMHEGIDRKDSAAYFTFEKSAGIRTSFPSCRFTTNTDTAFGSKLS